MSEQRWPPGAHITGRNIWYGRVFTAWPFVVVEDSAEQLALYLPPGTTWKHPTDAAGEKIRLPRGDWGFRDELWYGHGALRVLLPGVAHSVLVFLLPDGIDRWYVNLEEPFRRTPIGFDTRDHHLDLVFLGDLSGHRWKDADELAEEVERGAITPDAAARIYAEGERVIAQVRDGTHPVVIERWRRWAPEPHWTIPALAEGWDTLEPAL